MKNEHSVREGLRGTRVVITRAAMQSAGMRAALEGAGAQVVSFPTIRIEPRDVATLDEHLARLAEYDWILMTSANTVPIVMARIDSLGKRAALAHVQVAAIGPATAEALETYGVSSDVVPERYVAEGLLDALQGISGCRFLLPRAAEARAVLPETLRARGNQVDVVAVYDTVSSEPTAETLAEIAGPIDAVTFTSPSTVHHFVDLVPNAKSTLDRVVIACIGPVTAQAVERYGVKASVVADRYTVKGLVQALVKHFEGDDGSG